MKPPLPSHPVRSAPFGISGRDKEIQALMDFVTGLQRPAALLLHGEAGIGKTSLWRAAVAWTEETGVRTFTAFPAAAETKLPYAGLSDLFGGVDRHAIDALPERQRDALEAALLDGDPGDVSADGTYERAVAAATLNLLRGEAGSGPVVIALDDVQWLDAPSAEALTYAFRRLEGPIGFLMTARSGEAMPAALDPITTAPSTERIELAPLTLDGLDVAVLEHLGERLPLPVLIEVGRASGGNPLFALELGRALKEGRIAYRPGAPLDVPTDLRGVVGERLAGLPAEMIELLATVAVVSHPTRDLIGRILPDSEATIRRAMDKGLLRMRGDRLAPVHPLYGSVPLGEMGADARRSLYARAAADVADPEEKARLAALAGDPPDATVAQLLEDAGRHAVQRGAPQIGATLFEQAVAFSQPKDADARVDRMVLAAGCFFRSNRSDRAVELFEQAIASCPRGDRRAAIVFERLLVEDLPVDEMIARHEETLRDVTDPSLRAEMHARVAWDMISTYRVGPARAHVVAALRDASGVGDDSLRARAMSLAATLDFFDGHGVRRDLAEEAIELERKTARTSYDETSPRHRWAIICLWADLLDESRRHFLALREEALAEGHEPAVLRIDGYLTNVEIRAGDWIAARRYAESSDRIAELLHGVPEGARAIVDAHVGDMAAARRGAERERARAAANGEPFSDLVARCVLGFTDLAAGDNDAVISVLASFPDDLDALNPREPSHLRFHPDLVEAYVAIGDVESATNVADHLDRHVVVAPLPSAVAALARCRGWIASNDGRLEEGSTLLEESVVLHRRLGQPFELARTLLLTGSARRRARMWAKARASLQEAKGIFVELGASPWIDRARRELDKIGGRAPSRWELTPAEEQVATLASRGRTNNEIAQELFVTVKTVEWTLSKVYRKLQIRSRTELAALLRGTPTDPS